jgi:DNA-directed RNA polymerase specialized sigma24 family protein
MLSTYLYGVARNVSRDRFRRDRRLLAVLSNPWGGTTEPDDPFASVASTEAGAEVRRALALVPVRYREAIALCARSWIRFRCERGETCNPNSSICGVSSLAATPT